MADLPPHRRSPAMHTLSRLRSYFILDPLIFIYTAVMGAFSLLASVFDTSGRTQHWFARTWSWMILRTCMAPVKVFGNLDFSHPYVFAANHISAMDIPLLYMQIPVPFRIVANKNLFSYPFMGWHLKRSGQIPIDRSSPRATFKSLTGAVHDLAKGISVMIFPEGGRSPDGAIKPFMNGAFYLAIKAQVAVVPVAIVGTFEMLPMNTFHIMPRPLEIHFGEPISTAGMTTHDLETLAQRVQAAVEDLYYAHSVVPRPAPDAAVTLESQVRT